MARSKAPPRVKGPYSERGGARFRIRICDATGRHDLYFATRAEALAGMRQAARDLPAGSECRWLSAILDEYMRDKVQRGQCTARSAQEDLGRLRGWLAEHLEEDIGKLTPKRAAALYERLVETPTRKTREPPTAATHRCYLHRAQTLFRWAVRRGYVRENPFESVQPVGRPNRGRKQLRFEEADRFISAGFRMFDSERRCHGSGSSDSAASRLPGWRGPASASARSGLWWDSAVDRSWRQRLPRQDA